MKLTRKKLSLIFKKILFRKITNKKTFENLDYEKNLGNF